MEKSIIVSELKNVREQANSICYTDGGGCEYCEGDNR